MMILQRNENAAMTTAAMNNPIFQGNSDTPSIAIFVLNGSNNGGCASHGVMLGGVPSDDGVNLPPPFASLDSLHDLIMQGVSVEQTANLLHITPKEDNPANIVPVFMEILQVSNITVEEMEYKTLSAIDFAHYPIHFHNQPRGGFPFVEIQLIDGGRRDNTVTSIYIRDNYHGGVFVITTQYSFGRDWVYAPDFRNSMIMLEIIDEIDLLSDKGNTIIDSCVYNPVTIQDLFDSKFVIVFMEGMPSLIRHYPVGEVVEDDAEGMSSFVVFIRDFYQVEQQDNLLRIVSPWHNHLNYPDAFMEITQVPNITISEMKCKIKASFVPDSFSYLQGQSPVDFTFFTIELCNDLGFKNIYIRNNGNGGVFVITMQYCRDGITRSGVRFLNSIWTLETF